MLQDRMCQHYQILILVCVKSSPSLPVLLSLMGLWVDWFLMRCNTSELWGYYMLFIDCGCANGTVNCSGVCAKLGGQCPCAPNVVTRTCSACNCMFFGVDCEGCEGGNSVSCICSNCVYRKFNVVACNCNPNGTTAASLGSCDDSGQCVCKPDVTGLKCDTRICEVSTKKLITNCL